MDLKLVNANQVLHLLLLNPQAERRLLHLQVVALQLLQLVGQVKIHPPLGIARLQAVLQQAEHHQVVVHPRLVLLQQVLVRRQAAHLVVLHLLVRVRPHLVPLRAVAHLHQAPAHHQVVHLAVLRHLRVKFHLIQMITIIQSLMI